MTSGEEQRQVILALGKSFAQCTDFDLWGQPIEAIDGYKRWFFVQMNTYSEVNGHGSCPHVKYTIYLFSIYTCVCYERKGVMYVIKYTNFHVKGVDNNFSLI